MYVSHRAQLDPDSGCVEFTARFDVNNDGHFDLASSSYNGPYLRLWLGDTDRFHQQRLVNYNITSGGDVDMADLNVDGYPELIHSGYLSHCSIFWGNPSGPPDSETALENGGAEDVYVCDLDKDGWLDIILGGYYGTLYIYWGSANGYSAANRTAITVGSNVIGFNIVVADFDKDGWNDIALEYYGTSCPIYYWGPNRTYRNVVWLPSCGGSPHGLSCADFNKDGWLDLVYTTAGDASQARVYWGGASGFSSGNCALLNPGHSHGGSAAVDLDDDGWLDILFFWGRGPNGTPGPLPVYKNTGSPPYFDDSHVSYVGDVPVNSAGGVVADFDQDGHLDIFTTNHGNGGSSDDYVFWGPGFNTHTALPGDDIHHGSFREPRETYDRSQVAYYYSSIFDVGSGNRSCSGTASWIAYQPPGSRVSIAYRSGSTSVPDSTWTGFGTVLTNPGAIPDSVLGRRYVQYRAGFAFTNPCYLPDLEEISADLVTSSYDVGVGIILAPHDTVDSGTVIAPRAVVRNYGNRSATFPVTLRIGSGYSDVLTLTMGPGESDTVTFSDWSAGPRGVFEVKCTTALLNDSNPSNDAQTDSVMVIVHDVGAVRIVSPRGTLLPNDTVLPVAQVRNFGTTTETFRAVLRIGWAYSETAAAANLMPDSSAIIGFPEWIAIPGRHAVGCSTMLAQDLNPLNDKVTDSVVVMSNVSFDVGIEEILAPAGIVDLGATVTPAAVVCNYGTQTASFPVYFRIAGSYVDSRNVNLASGQADTVTFASWTAGPVGTVQVKCTTALANDSNPLNNALQSSVLVGYRDVGSVQILAPRDSIHTGQRVAPQAVVRNFGNTTESFDVLFRIGNSYSDTAHVNGLLPDSTGVVTFRVWTAAGGNCLLCCSTLLATDMNHPNDKVEDSLRVLQTIADVRIMSDQADSLEPGDSITDVFTVTNYGNAEDIIDIELDRQNNLPGWTYGLLDMLGVPLTDHNADGIPDVGTVAPAGGTAQFRLRVKAPADAQQGLSDTVQLWASSSNIPTVRQSVNVTTRIEGRLLSLTVDPSQSDHLCAGMTNTYTLYVETQGNMADNVGLNLYCGDPQWHVELRDSTGDNVLPDTNLDQWAEFGIVPPAARRYFTVKVKAPDSISGDLIGKPESLGMCHIRVIGQTTFRNPQTAIPLRDTAWLTIQAVPGLAIHNFENPFHGSTQFIFSTPRDGNVRLFIYDRAGQLVRRLIKDQNLQTGIHLQAWDGKNDNGRKLGPGTYLYVFELTDKQSQRQQVMKKLMIR